MYDFLKTIAESNGWVFEYARTDYQNLYNLETSGGTVHLFCDPIVSDSKFSDSGVETISYSGKLMLLLSSDIDESYSDKYNDYIKPLVAGATQTLKDGILCSDYEINKFQTTEIINLFDFNMDGILVNYSITILD